MPDQLLGFDATRWRSLFYFNIYRLVLSVVLVVFAIYGAELNSSLHRYPIIFLGGSFSLMVLAMMYFVSINRGVPSLGTQIHGQVFIDLTAIALLIHSSDGFQSGYGFLMIVSVAAVSLLDTRRTGIAYAAYGTLLALGEETLSQLMGYSRGNTFQGPALIGIGLFSTALVVTTLASRIRRSDELVSQRETELARMDTINQQVVELVPTGVLAVDKSGRILMCNARARTLLNLDLTPLGQNLNSISPEISQALELAEPRPESPTGWETQVVFQGRTIQPWRQNFGNISLVFLEDLPSEREQAREIRLAAMGRLAAAIAHEIRNPLSAIYQAGQLLSESDELSSEDRQIAQIVGQQCERLDRTVETVLLISRGDPGNSELIVLDKWIERFVEQFCSIKGIEKNRIEQKCDNHEVVMDSHHLEQILSNLIENALAHTELEEKPFVTLKTGRNDADHRVFLDIIDYGSKIPNANRERLFEPFFTTHSRGTGLGLYISRELCEANQARLSYHEAAEQKSFRITFPIEPTA